MILFNRVSIAKEGKGNPEPTLLKLDQIIKIESITDLRDKRVTARVHYKGESYSMNFMYVTDKFTTITRRIQKQEKKNEDQN